MSARDKHDHLIRVGTMVKHGDLVGRVTRIYEPNKVRVWIDRTTTMIAPGYSVEIVKEEGMND